MASRADDLVECPGRVPGVGVAGHRPEGLLRAAAADQDRQVRLDGAGELGRIVESVGRAVVVDRLPVEQPPDDPDRLIEPVEPLAEAGPEVDPVGLVLALEPGAPDAQHGPSVADVVEGGGELGGQAWVPEGVRPDHQAEPYPAGQGGPGRQAQPALEDRLTPGTLDGEQVVPRPEAVPAGGLGGEGGRPDPGPVAGLRPELGTEPGRARWRARHGGSLAHRRNGRRPSVVGSTAMTSPRPHGDVTDLSPLCGPTFTVRSPRIHLTAC